MRSSCTASREEPPSLQLEKAHTVTKTQRSQKQNLKKKKRCYEDLCARTFIAAFTAVIKKMWKRHCPAQVTDVQSAGCRRHGHVRFRQMLEGRSRPVLSLSRAAPVGCWPCLETLADTPGWQGKLLPCPGWESAECPTVPRMPEVAVVVRLRDSGVAGYIEQLY